MARVYRWVRTKRIALAFCALTLLGVTVGLWALAANGNSWPWPYEVWESGNMPRAISFADAKAEVEWMVGEEVNMVGTAGAWGEISSHGTPIDIPLSAFEGPAPEVIDITYDFFLSFTGGGYVTQHISGVPYFLVFVWEFGAVYAPPPEPITVQWGSEMAPDPILSAGLAQEFVRAGEQGNMLFTPSVLIRSFPLPGTPQEENPIAFWRAGASFLYEFKAQPNAPPTAVINATPTVGDAPLTVSFNGLGSFDTDGTIVNYTWSFGDGTSASGPVVSHPYNNPNNYTATLVVTDDQGATDSASVAITVNQPNLPPVAVATATPAVALIGKPIQFSSAGSSDPEGGALTYSWDFGDNATSTEANPAHAYAQPKDYAVTLTVKDPRGAQATATLNVQVVAVDKLVVEPALATLLSEQKQQFTAKGIWYGPDGIPETPDDRVHDVTSLVSWRVEPREAGGPAPGAVDVTGLFTAGIPAGDDRQLRGFVVASLTRNTEQMESRAEVEVWEPTIQLAWIEPEPGPQPKKWVHVGDETRFEAKVTYSAGKDKAQPWDFAKHGKLDYEWTVTYLQTGEKTETRQLDQGKPPEARLIFPEPGKYSVKLKVHTRADRAVSAEIHPPASVSAVRLTPRRGIPGSTVTVKLEGARFSKKKEEVNFGKGIELQEIVDKGAGAKIKIAADAPLGPRDVQLDKDHVLERGFYVGLVTLEMSPDHGPIGTIITLQLKPAPLPAGFGFVENETTVDVTGVFSVNGKTTSPTTLHYPADKVTYVSPTKAEIVLGEVSPPLTWWLANSAIVGTRQAGVLSGGLTVNTGRHTFEIPNAQFTIEPSTALGWMENGVLAPRREALVYLAESIDDINNAPDAVKLVAQVLLPREATSAPPMALTVVVKSFDQDDNELTPPSGAPPASAQVTLPLVGSSGRSYIYRSSPANAIIPLDSDLPPGSTSYIPIYAVAGGRLAIIANFGE